MERQLVGAKPRSGAQGGGVDLAALGSAGGAAHLHGTGGVDPAHVVPGHVGVLALLERRHRDVLGDQVWKLSDRHDGLSDSCPAVESGPTDPARSSSAFGGKRTKAIVAN